MTAEALRHALAAAAIAAAWLIPRRIAAARMVLLPAVLLDLFPVVLAAALLLLATGRPLFTGVVVLALGGGFALADQAKREALREPVVFSDMSEARHIFTHPHLYLPFAGPGLVYGGAATMSAIAIGLFVFGPALWQPEPLIAAVASLAVCAMAWTLSREPALSMAAASLRRLQPCGEPDTDAARLGPFASLLVYGIIARSERAHRQAQKSPLPMPALNTSHGARPVVIVQCESFFDARRLSPRIPRDLLRGFDACVQSGATYGRFDVSAWGANTMRAEFSALTGISDDCLGYDRFNPYHAFARSPLASLASRLRDQGYRTLCLHPFDRGFFRRDLILKALGFEVFLCRDELGGSRRPPYQSDPELARKILRVLEAEGPRTFIFAITMGNHGPWLDTGIEISAAARGLFAPEDLPQGGELLRYLDGLTRSDEMLRPLLDELGPRRRNALFGFYGDHLPSLPHAFAHLGFDDTASDYVLVDGDAPIAQRLDLPAHVLPLMVLNRLHQGDATMRRRATMLGAA